MKIIIHQFHGRQIAEIQSDGIIMRNLRDAMGVVGEILSRGVKELILHERNVAPEFFQLRTGIAGELLQKLTNHQIRVAFVGDFGSDKSKSMRAFIAESNSGNQVSFAGSLESALERLSSV